MKLPRLLLFLLFCLLFLPAALRGHEATRPEGNAKEGGSEPSPAASREVTVALRDAGDGSAIPGMIRVRRAGGGDWLGIPELLDRCLGLSRNVRKSGWHVLAEPTPIALPRSRLTIEAISGLERTRATKTVDLREGSGDEEVRLELKRFWNAAERGLVAGNTHLHLKDLDRAEADRYLREVPLADGLEVVFVSYAQRAIVDRTYISNDYSRSDLEALSGARHRLGNGEEYRHNFGRGGQGYGHVMFLDLPERILPASIGPGITKNGDDGTPLRSGIECAHDQDATVIWCHNRFGYEDLPSWLAGLVQAQNIFDGGNLGGYEDTYYRYLDLGMRVPFSTGTDWFIYDYSRVYADPGVADPTVAEWLAGLRSGKTFITNGPLLELSVNGARPGGEVRADGELEVRFRVVGRKDFGVPQLVRGGEVLDGVKVRRREHEGWFEAIGTHRLSLDRSAWIALRVSPDLETTSEFRKPLFAHTGPVYIEAEDDPRFDPEVARGLIAEIERDLAAIEKVGRFEDDAGRERVRALYEDAIAILEKALDRGRLVPR